MGIQSKMLDPDPDSVNPDPKHLHIIRYFFKNAIYFYSFLKVLLRIAPRSPETRSVRRKFCVLNTTSSTRDNLSIAALNFLFYIKRAGVLPVYLFSSFILRYGTDVRNIAYFPSNRFGGFPPFYCLEFLHANYEILEGISPFNSLGRGRSNASSWKRAWGGGSSPGHQMLWPTSLLIHSVREGEKMLKKIVNDLNFY
jgi:hypothetical protein